MAQVIDAQGKVVREQETPAAFSGSTDGKANAIFRAVFRELANRLRGVHAVRRGDDPYWLKRLPNKFIFRLPRRTRRTWA